MPNIAKIRKYYRSSVAPAESTGGVGTVFENDIQALFATLMVCGGELDIFPNHKIESLQLQVFPLGYCTDDILVRLVDGSGQRRKLLGQVKRSIRLIPSCTDFTDSVQAAWIDFKNQDLFSKGKDVIALITGPLNSKDNDKLNWLFNRARNSTQDAFSLGMQSGRGISKEHRDAYAMMCEILAVQNDGPVELDDLYLFLRSFYILQPDMWYEGGMVSSFASSLLKSHFASAPPRTIFNEIVRQIKTRNGCNGDISRKALLEAIMKNCNALLRNELVETEEETSSTSIQIRATLSLMKERSQLHEHHLALLALIGMWQETKQEERQAVCEILHIDEAGLEACQQELIDSEPPLMLTEGSLVRIFKRRSAWRATAGKVSSVMVERFLHVAKEQLAKVDRRLDVLPEERLFSDEQSGFSVSETLRIGLAEGLAILGVHYDCCSRVAQSVRANWTGVFVRTCLQNADWKTWASLDDLLPYLAEAAPDEYLASVNRFLQLKENGAGELFAQERPGLMGRTYLGGFIEALQRLAWLPQYFASVLDILARLAQIDPGGQIGPRPADIMQRILHPYGAHTTVEASVRMDVFSALLNKYPEPLWNVLVGLLPGDRYAFVEGAGEPVYRLPANMKKAGEGVTRAEAYEQFNRYGIMAVAQCGTDPDRMISLIQSAIQYWRDEPFNALGKHLQQTAAVIPDEQRFVIWGKLRSQLRYLRSNDKTDAKFAEWLASREKAVLNLISLFEPQDPGFRSLPLFSYSVEFEDLDESGKTREEFRAEIAQKQKEAVAAVWKAAGTDGFLKFASRAEKSQLAGQFFGEVAPSSVDAELLPGKLCFDREGDYWPIAGYVASRFEKEGWQWVDALVRDGWTTEQRAMLLVLLPFGRETWHMVDTLLGEDDGLYWQHADPCGRMEGDNAEAAVSGFLKHGCLYTAAQVLSFASIGEKPPRADLSRRILAAFISTPALDHPNSMSDYHIEEMIKSIQQSNVVDPRETARYEWHFFELFEHGKWHDFSPIALNLELANDPQLFCEALELAFLTETEAKIPIDEREEKQQTELERRRSTNSWRLLENEWKTIPGVDSTGTFNSTVFRNWVEEAFSKAKELDRLQAAKSVLGHVFSNSPEVSDFWMPHEVAELMEEPGNEQMLRSFETAIFNSRGAHWVDPTLKADRDLAEQYECKAQQADRFGYLGVARAMRNLAKTTMDLAQLGKESSDQRDTLYKALLEEKNGIHATEN